MIGSGEDTAARSAATCRPSGHGYGFAAKRPMLNGASQDARVIRLQLTPERPPDDPSRRHRRRRARRRRPSSASRCSLFPARRSQQKPTLGLDLQGGLEVTLQAVPPRDRKLTKEDLDRSVTIMRNRVDKLGVAEPEIRTQGNDQIAIQLPGVKDPAAAAQIIGKTAQLELFDLEANLVAAVDRRRTRQPIATPKLYDLLAGQQALAAKGTPDTYYVFRTKGKKLVVGPVQTQEAALAQVGRQAARRAQAVRGAAARRSSSRCGAGRGRVPRRAAGNPDARTSGTCFGYTPPERPRDDGRGPQAVRHAAGLRHADAASRSCSWSSPTRAPNKFEKITRDMRSAASSSSTRSAAGRATAGLPPALRDRPRPRDQVVAVDRLQAVPGRDRRLERRADLRPRELGEAKDLALVLQTGALPVEFRTLDQTAISATLGKDSLERGEEGGDRRADRRRALPAHLLPLPRARRGHGARGLRRLPLRGDPALQRDAHAARASPASC